MTDIKIIFMGTPEFAVPILEGLIENYNIIAVVTQPDKLVGRKKELKYPPIKEKALEHNIKVLQPIKIRKEYDEILNLKPDLIVTCAYGQIIPKEILDCPPLGCINVHASLLPKLRGGAPIHRAIIEGYEKTGITIMYMDETMDTGDIISTREYLIKDTDNVGDLHDTLSKIGKELLLDTLPSIIKGTNSRLKQDNNLATYAKNISREDEHLDFSLNCSDIFNKVRGLNPWPLANLILDEEIKILECFYETKKINEETGTIVEIKKDAIGITCRNGIIYLTKIKPSGKKIMSVKDYLNGTNKEGLLKKRVK